MGVADFVRDVGAEEEFFRILVRETYDGVETHMKDTLGEIGCVDDENIGGFHDSGDIGAGFAIAGKAESFGFGFKNQTIGGNHGGVVDEEWGDFVVLDLDFLMIVFFDFGGEMHPGVGVDVLIERVEGDDTQGFDATFREIDMDFWKGRVVFFQNV